MASASALRIYDVSKATGRPLPPFSDDPVLDYMVAEAIVARAGQRSKDDEKQRQKDEWKSQAHQSGFQPQ